MENKTLTIISVSMLGLSALSFFIMRSFESQIAECGAVAFGFTSIIIMIASGLRKLREGKIAKFQN